MARGTERARGGPATGTSDKRRLYAVEFVPAAERDLKRLVKSAPKEVIVAIAAAIEGLQANPRPPGVEKLSGREDIFRVREGDYRIVYQIRDALLLVVVVRIGHRREVYANIQKLVRAWLKAAR